jgi:hypothetical protein
MIPLQSTHQGHQIDVVKTPDGWQGTIYKPNGDFLAKTAFHHDSAHAFTEAHEIIDIDISSRRRW